MGTGYLGCSPDNLAGGSIDLKVADRFEGQGCKGSQRDEELFFHECLIIKIELIRHTSQNPYRDRKNKNSESKRMFLRSGIHYDSEPAGELQFLHFQPAQFSKQLKFIRIFIVHPDLNGLNLLHHDITLEVKD